MSYLENEIQSLFPSLYDFDNSGIAITSEHPSIVAAEGLSDTFDIRTLMEEAVDPLTGTLRDLKLDDRDLKLASSFYEYSTKFCNANPPWARQMLTYSILFGDICPKCSNPDWLNVLDVPVDYPTKDLPEHITFLEHGKCPNCGSRKHELYRDGMLNLYQELVLVWGQRCVAGGTIVLTENGPARIAEAIGDAPYGFTKSSIGVHNGDHLENASHVFVGRPERLKHVRFSNGSWLEGTSDHPIKVVGKGFVKISNLQQGDTVAVRINQQVFGKSVPDVSAIINTVLNDKTITGPYQPKFANKPVFSEAFATFLGLWVAEGYGSSINSNYPTVLDKAENGLLDVFDSSCIHRSGNTIRVSGKHQQTVLAKLMGLELLDLWCIRTKRSIPTTIMMAPKEYQTAFLSGLYSSGRCNGVMGSTYSTVSKQLATDLYSVLANLGVYVHCISYSKLTYSLLVQGVYFNRLSSIISYCHYGNGSSKQVASSTECIDDIIHINVESVTDGDIETSYDFTLPKTHRFISNGVLSHNSGKSHTGTLAMSYLTHRWLKFPKLSTLAPESIQQFTPLTATMVSLTFSKAVNLLWAPFKSIIENTPWFSEYHAFLDHYGNHYGTEFYRAKELFLKYYNKNLHLYPSHPAANILRGDTRFMAAIDELGLFTLPREDVREDADETSERANAKEAITSLESSLATVSKASRTILQRGYDHVPPTMLFGLSSPKHQKDMVMRRLRLSYTENGRKILLGSQLATWDVNPNLPRDDPFIVGKFESDAVAAMRDFGAEPPRISSTYVPPSHFIKERYPFVGKPNALKLDYEYSEEEVWGVIRNAVDGRNPFPTVIALDAGYSDNSFSICAVGIDPENDYKITVPALVEIIPRGGLTISFNKVYKNVLLPFTRAMRGQVWIADRWSSHDLLSRAKDDIQGLDVRQHTLKLSAFENFLQVLWNGNLVLPHLDRKDAEEVKKLEIDDYRPVFTNEPIKHLLNQFLTVQRGLGANACPEKAIGFTDDSFRALVLGTYAITNSRIYELVKKESVSYNAFGGEAPPAIFVSRSFNRRF